MTRTKMRKRAFKTSSFKGTVENRRGSNSKDKNNSTKMTNSTCVTQTDGGRLTFSSISLTHQVRLPYAFSLRRHDKSAKCESQAPRIKPLTQPVSRIGWGPDRRWSAEPDPGNIIHQWRLSADFAEASIDLPAMVEAVKSHLECGLAHRRYLRRTAKSLRDHPGPRQPHLLI